MEMDGRDNAKCQKSKFRDMIGIILILNDNRTKLSNSVIFSLYSKDQKREGGGRKLTVSLRF